MYPFKNMSFPFSSMFNNNQFGFNPFELQRQMMKQTPMMSRSTSFPFNMLKQLPSGENHQIFPYNMLDHSDFDFTTFPFNLMKETNVSNSYFPFNFASNPSSDMISTLFQTQNRQQWQNSVGNQQPYLSNFPHSLIRDQNGKMDFNKISHGLQSTVGLIRYMGPMMKMFGGFVR